MKYLIEIMANAADGRVPKVRVYLKSMDWDAKDGDGQETVTANPHDAMQFDSAAAALEFYRTVSKKRPVRTDGRPNRPLTAWTVGIMKLDEEGD